MQERYTGRMTQTRPNRPPPHGRRTGTPGNDPRHPTGTPASGEIIKLFIGQGHGYIRLGDRNAIYFHRGDLAERSSFNTFEVGDAVAFDLLEDRFSGPRALNVRPLPPRVPR